MFLLLQFLAELQIMPKSKIKVAHLVTIKNFVFKIQKSHMDTVNDLIQLQKTIGEKNDSIISLQNKVAELSERNSLLSSDLPAAQIDKIDVLQASIDSILPKLDCLTHSSPPDEPILHNISPNNQLSPKSSPLPLSSPLSGATQDCNMFLSDRDLNHIDSKIDELRDKIVQLSPRGEAKCPHHENTNEITDNESNSESQFDPSTHDWDNREWVEVEHKRKRKQTSPKPLS